MRPTFVILAFVFMAGILQGIAYSQANFLEGIPYICNGEQIFTHCDPDNKSDTAICSTTYEDRRTPRGALVTKSSTRGEMSKLFATCQPPDAKSLEQKKQMDQSDIDAQKRALDEQARYVEMMKAKMQGASGDPGTIEMRRCVAAGRAPLQCLGEVFNSGLKTMAGGDAGMGSAYGKTLPPGMRMTGNYGDGHFWLKFTEKNAWVGCEAAAYEADYAVVMKNGQVVVTTTPGPGGQKLGNKPLAFMLMPDGRFMNSGMIDITGSVKIGEQPIQTTEKRYLSSYELNQYHSETVHKDSGGYYIEQPAMGKSALYSTKTSRCSPATIPPTGTVGPTYATQAMGQLTGSQTSAMFGGAPWESRSTKDRAWPDPGLRLTGTYQGNGGLRLEFHEDSVILGCREAFSARSYMVINSDAKTAVKIENENASVVLAIGPDMSLSGSGSINVAGHAFIGDRQGGSNGSMFAPVRATCTMGILTPRR